METTLDAPMRPIASKEEPTLHPIAKTQRYWPRLAFVGILAFAAYAFVIADVVGDLLSGSRAVVLLVAPILVGVIATGYREAPRGVSDSESDWIVAIVVGVLGFTGIHVLQQRMPTLAVLWHLNLLGVVLWTGCLFAIMFGVRYVVRMWQLWLFAVCCVSPLPFLMTAAAFGGSDIAITLLTVALGALAAYLAGRHAPVERRAVATLVCLVCGSVLTVILGEHLSLSATAVLVAGVVPLIVTVVMLWGSGDDVRTAPNPRTELPRRSPLSLATLVLVAGLLLALNPPHSRDAQVPSVAGDWAQRAGLGTPEMFPFITRFVGADATLVRYSVPAKAGMPTAAVDVIATRRPSALHDFDAVVWYPSSTPLQYQVATGESMPAGARIIHSNADAATDAETAQWYAVTWVWNAGATYQRVTVIVNQNVDSDAPPPAPEELSLFDATVKPALWLARQQPYSTGKVDPPVIERADDVIDQLQKPPADASENEAGV